MSASEAFVSWPVHHHQWLPDPPLPSPAISAFATNVGVDNGAAVGLSRRTSCCHESGGRGTDQALLGLWFSDENQCASFGRKRRRQGPYGRLWLPLASSATPTPTPPPASIESDGTAAKGDGAPASSSNEVASDESRPVGSGGRVAGDMFEFGTNRRTGRPALGRDEAYKTARPSKDESSGRSRRRSSAPGRLRLKWGVDLDIPVPVALEALVTGPWDPQGDMWERQLDMAAQVISRSGGVVFMEQLAPILNPREGPLEWYRVCADAGGGFYEKGDKSGISVDAVGGEALVLRVLLDLNGSPEVTSDGDILYVFPGFARGKRGREGNIEADFRSEESETGSTAAPEVLQFEEVPRLLEALPKILPDQGPKVVKEFFQRTALSGLALFLSVCLVLGQLIFNSWPIWLAIGPAYLVWVGLDDTWRRSRNKSAKQRDQWREQWADVCRGDGDAIWRKRAAARAMARRLDDGA
ncbi:unnamed protein product [Ectocarpus sp. 12 AP-2014]